jgi:hypothetical protein
MHGFPHVQPNMGIPFVSGCVEWYVVLSGVGGDGNVGGRRGGPDHLRVMESRH